ncbi:hypothetical protein BOTBODRAFT_58606 [Botryobasidium botryosum FD-172 SS1]|uniref:Uncharacterized protein n=1 Tax=Botryobasidium botryosum (strain FD-172 SS1) TaxID=930990 RepID=A0A067M4A1_BOTB1|nr:hypothetical protein BOTBODRAFT_58606 [Botryobasidium botryosum FD-172 SS1]
MSTSVDQPLTFDLDFFSYLGSDSLEANDAFARDAVSGQYSYDYFEGIPSSFTDSVPNLEGAFKPVASPDLGPTIASELVFAGQMPNFSPMSFAGLMAAAAAAGVSTSPDATSEPAFPSSEDILNTFLDSYTDAPSLVSIPSTTTTSTCVDSLSSPDINAKEFSVDPSWAAALVSPFPDYDFSALINGAVAQPAQVQLIGTADMAAIDLFGDNLTSPCGWTPSNILASFDATSASTTPTLSPASPAAKTLPKDMGLCGWQSDAPSTRFAPGNPVSRAEQLMRPQAAMSSPPRKTSAKQSKVPATTSPTQKSKSRVQPVAPQANLKRKRSVETSAGNDKPRVSSSRASTATSSPTRRMASVLSKPSPPPAPEPRRVIIPDRELTDKEIRALFTSEHSKVAPPTPAPMRPRASASRADANPASRTTDVLPSVLRSAKRARV